MAVFLVGMLERILFTDLVARLANIAVTTVLYSSKRRVGKWI
jgi:hypothetical protein